METKKYPIEYQINEEIIQYKTMSLVNLAKLHKVPKYQNKIKWEQYGGTIDNKKLEEIFKSINVQEIFNKINLDDLFKKMPWDEILRGLDIFLAAINFIEHPIFDFIIRNFLNAIRIAVSAGTTAASAGVPAGEKVIDILFICLNASKLMLSITKTTLQITKSSLELATKEKVLDLFKSLNQLEFVSPGQTQEDLEKLREEYNVVYKIIILEGICNAIQKLITKISSVIGDAIGASIPYQSGVLATVIPEAINLSFYAGQGSISVMHSMLVDYWEHLMDPDTKELFLKNNMTEFIDKNFGFLNNIIKNLVKDDKEGDKIIDRIIEALDPVKIQQVVNILLKPILQALIVTLNEALDPLKIVQNIAEAHLVGVAMIPLNMLILIGPLGPLAMVLQPILPFIIVTVKNLLININKVIKNPEEYEHIDVDSFLNNQDVNNIIIKIKVDIYMVLKDKLGDFIKRTFLKDIIKQVILYLEKIVDDIIKNKKEISHTINNSFALVFSFSEILMVDCMGDAGETAIQFYDASKVILEKLKEITGDIRKSQKKLEYKQIDNKLIEYKSDKNN